MCVLLMKRYLILSFFIIVGWGYSLAQSWSADNGNGTYTNPIFYDECSDPDIIRVGEDFYLTSTTMHSGTCQIKIFSNPNNIRVRAFIIENRIGICPIPIIRTPRLSQRISPANYYEKRQYQISFHK